jgi:hypothetical protein
MNDTYLLAAKERKERKEELGAGFFVVCAFLRG